MDTLYSDKNKGRKNANKSNNEHKSDSDVNIYQTISDIINEETNTQIKTIKTTAQIQEEFIKIVSEMTLEEVFININLISKIEYNNI